jgi:hypothetical protein
MVATRVGFQVHQVLRNGGCVDKCEVRTLRVTDGWKCGSCPAPALDSSNEVPKKTKKKGNKGMKKKRKREQKPSVDAARGGKMAKQKNKPKDANKKR